MKHKMEDVVVAKLTTKMVDKIAKYPTECLLIYVSISIGCFSYNESMFHGEQMNESVHTTVRN